MGAGEIMHSTTSHKGKIHHCSFKIITGQTALQPGDLKQQLFLKCHVLSDHHFYLSQLTEPEKRYLFFSHIALYSILTLSSMWVKGSLPAEIIKSNLHFHLLFVQQSKWMFSKYSNQQKSYEIFAKVPQTPYY